MVAVATTTFRPDPTCFAPSNLYFASNPNGAGWACETYYEPFASKPTEDVVPPSCPTVYLGRPGDGNYNDLCYQDNWISTGNTIFSSTMYTACPEGFTGATTVTNTYSAITREITACCPTAYDFAPAWSREPTAILSEIDGTTYPVTFSTLYAYCKAASIKTLSGKQVTLSVSTARSEPATTTVTDWDYDNGFILATAAMIQKYLYTGRPGTTSTCFGDSHCIMNNNPLAPRPTRAPRGTYVVPPVTPVTQFTPAPSCLSASNVWLVSDRCSIANRGYTGPIPTAVIPPWLSCTHTVAGNPEFTPGPCYPGASTLNPDGIATYYTGCPAGYTLANSTTLKPFSLGGAAWSVDATRLTCCPSAFNSVSFTHMSPGWTYRTVHDGTAYAVSSATLPPFCGASGANALPPGGTTLTMGLYSNPGPGAPGKRYEGASTSVWGAGDTLYAEAVTVMWTVFRGTHTCFEWTDCQDYFTYSYDNTMGEGIVVVTPTPTKTVVKPTAGGAGAPGATGTGLEPSLSTGGAVAVLDGRGKAVVMVVVTVVYVAVGALA
ncbi:hypothetical protein C8A05DRAFT_31018 [Staphylotrichum tortipilum]|uniref:Uncharacterized protein n=1 Tax=Staphylotrichum tortipilum TaxID=2831512 RepID=A0AAN6MRJ8_9PEZI|nr:hypothetical protein C8A05DRAFT_31018 [Staphylotrichum longicolle]